MPARWNEDKAKLNIKKHDGVSFEQAAQVFFDPFVQYRDASRNNEKREGALGCDFDFWLLLVVHLDIEDEFRAPLKIQSSPKCKARKKFRRAAYGYM